MKDISFSKKAKKYDVWQVDCEIKTGADRLEIIKPDNSCFESYFFYNIPISFIYDVHGYETLNTDGEPFLSAKFCPDTIGKYKFNIYKSDELLTKGEFYCDDSDNHGYIKVSEKDNRYFKYTDGTPYIPIGINMVYPQFYLRTDGTEFGTTSKTDTLGIKCYEKWIEKFVNAGGNYLRIWLGHEYFNVDSDIAGTIKYQQFSKIDKIVELAKKYGIKLKFTLEQFRHIGDETSLFTKKIRLPNGQACCTADEWLNSEIWQKYWREKVKEYLKRYSSEPTVAVWELWNEMLCFESSPEKITKWTSDTVKFIKENAPNQLVTTSFGSLNPLHGEKWYNAHFLEELDFLQVHRYLDQGEKEELRRTEPFLNTSKAITDISIGTKPAVLAETGAVNDNHSGPFRYYLSDDRGIIFADTVYPAFFAGSAGCGQIWHWDDRYVSAKGLFKMFKPFAQLVNGIDPEIEDFQYIDCSNEKVYCSILKGKNNALGFIRNRSDSWQNVLRDNKKTEALDNIFLEFDNYSEYEFGTVKIWEDETAQLKATKNHLQFNNLKYGIFFYIKKGVEIMNFNDREKIIALTPLWKGERLPDGRPKVEDKYLDALYGMTLEEVWKPIFVLGYEHQFVGGGENPMFTLHNDDRKLVGRAVTCTYCPTRPDLHDVQFSRGAEDGLQGNYNQWVIDHLYERDVVVCDMYDKIYKGTFLGGNLTTALQKRTKNGGAVVWGGIRDVEQMKKVPDVQVYYRGIDPTPIREFVMKDWNDITNFGGAVCLPGDIVFGAGGGVLFIPSHLVADVVEGAAKTHVKDDFGFEMICQGKFTTAQIDRNTWSEEMLDMLLDWIKNDPRGEEYRDLDWSKEYDLARNGDPDDTQTAL